MDVLLYSGSYLGGAYPICKEIFKTEAKRMEVKVKNVNLIFDVKLFHARNQVGKMVNFLRDIGWDDSRIVDELVKALKVIQKVYSLSNTIAKTKRRNSSISTKNRKPLTH